MMTMTNHLRKRIGPGVFYFNPEGQVGSGSIPDSISPPEADVNRTALLEETSPPPATQDDASTTPDTQTH